MLRLSKYSFSLENGFRDSAKMFSSTNILDFTHEKSIDLRMAAAGSKIPNAPCEASLHGVLDVAAWPAGPGLDSMELIVSTDRSHQLACRYFV